MRANELGYRLSTKVALVFQAAALLGGIALAMGFLQTPQRTWVSVFVACNFLIGLGLGGALVRGPSLRYGRDTGACLCCECRRP